MLKRDARATRLCLEIDRIDDALQRLGPGAVVHSAGQAIVRHDDDRLGPAGTDEVQAFVEDPFGALVGLIEFRPR